MRGKIKDVKPYAASFQPDQPFSGSVAAKITDGGSFESGYGEVFWWSSTADGLTGAWRRTLRNESAKVDRETIGNVDGLSVRCLKDN
jgi:hypothetical protein